MAQVIPLFEQAVRNVAEANKVRIRYIANIEDEFRKERIKKLLANENIHLYFAASSNLNSASVQMPNFLIFDGKEVVVCMPGFGESDTFIAIKSEETAAAFDKYFNLLWEGAEKFDKASFIGSTKK